MNPFPATFQIRLSLIVLSLMSLLALPGAARAQSMPPVIGSQNTVTADPPVSRPHEQPCVVQLFSGFQFVNYNIQDYQFTPSCAGPFEKIVFTADFNVTAGVQYDRTAIVDLAYVNIYFGTTAEPGTTLSPSWHVERDLTDYAALFSSAQTGHVILGNSVNSTYNGVISGSAELEFYPAHSPAQAPPAADAVLPLTQSNGSGGINEPATLNTGADQLATTFTLPQNIERAYLDVISQSQIDDEFWYTLSLIHIWPTSERRLVPRDPSGRLSNLAVKRSTPREFSILPLYSMNPSFLNLFMNILTRERVVPIISASVS